MGISSNNECYCGMKRGNNGNKFVKKEQLFYPLEGPKTLPTASK